MDKKDIFRILKERHSGYWLADDKQSRNLTYSQYLDTLMAIEEFVIDVELEKVPSLEKYDAYKKNDNQPKLLEIQAYFSKLRYDLPVVKNIEFSERYNIFDMVFSKERVRSHLQRLANQTINSPLNRVGDTEAVNSDSDAEVKLATNAEIFLRNVKEIKRNLQGIHTQELIAKREWGARQAYKQMKEYLESCFQVCPTVHVLCMDFGYLVTKMPNDICKPSISLDIIIRHWGELRQRLAIELDVLGHIERLEFSDPKGYSIYTVLLLKHHHDRTEDEWVIFFGNLWRGITQPWGAYHCFNPDIAAIDKNATGIISSEQTNKRHAFNRWVLEYMAFSGIYWKVDTQEYANQSVWQTGKFPQAETVTVEPEQPIRQPLHQLLLGAKDAHHLWDIDNVGSSYLSTKYKEIACIYQAFRASAEFGQLPLHLYDLFEKIEYFMVHLMCYRLPAFDVLHTTSFNSEYDFVKRMTKLGKQLIFIERSFTKIDFDNFILSVMHNLSTSVLLFFTVAFTQKSEDTPKTWSLFRFDQRPLITREEAMFYNGIVLRIRKYLNLELGAFENLGDESSFLMSFLVERMRFLSLNANENTGKRNKNAGNSAIGLKMIVKDLSLQQMLKRQSDTLNSTYDSTVLYVKEVLKNDTLLICIRLYLKAQTPVPLPHSIFSSVLSEFMRLGRNKKPLSWTVGYIGRWEVSSGQSYARVIFMLDSNKVEDVDSVASEISNYWAKIVTDHAEKIQLKISPDTTPLVLESATSKSEIFQYHEFFSDFFCRVDRSDRIKQQAFIQQIVLVLVKKNLYFWGQFSKLANHLIKGDKPRFAPSDKKNAVKPQVKKRKHRQLKEQDSISNAPKNTEETTSDLSVYQTPALDSGSADGDSVEEGREVNVATSSVDNNPPTQSDKLQDMGSLEKNHIQSLPSADEFIVVRTIPPIARSAKIRHSITVDKGVVDINFDDYDLKNF